MEVSILCKFLNQEGQSMTQQISIHTTATEENIKFLKCCGSNKTLKSGIEFIIESVRQKNNLLKSDQMFLNDIADKLVINGKHENTPEVMRLRSIASHGYNKVF